MNLPAQQQQPPGQASQLGPRPDHRKGSYQGSGRLAGKAAVVAGADSGIGRAVAIAYAREGANVLIAYASDHEDAQETAAWIERAGRKAVLVPGDLASAAHCRNVIDAAVVEFGRVDVLVSNAAQLTHATLQHMPPGSSVIGTSPLGRPGQPAEAVPAYVLLACDEASYACGAKVTVTGGKPIF